MKVFLDTHAALALADGTPEALGRRSADLVRESALALSPAVRLEVAVLVEIGRIDRAALELGQMLADDLGVDVANDSFDAVVAEAMKLTWTRDPFDRLIVAHAMLHRAPLITRDDKVRANYARAVW